MDYRSPLAMADAALADTWAAGPGEVRAGLHGKLGAIRLWLRGLGMGGAASILIWNMGYDPVFTAIELATDT